jgi:hypothetical protein
LDLTWELTLARFWGVGEEKPGTLVCRLLRLPLVDTRKASKNRMRASWSEPDFHDARHLFTSSPNLPRKCHDTSSHSSYCSRSFVAVIVDVK